MSAGDIIYSQAKDLIIAAMTEADPSLDLREGTPQYSALVAPHVPMVASIVEKLNDAEVARNASNWLDFSDEQADALAYQNFAVRSEGAKSRGTLRLKYVAPGDVSLDAQAVIGIGENVYHPQVAVALEEFDFSRDGTLGHYFVDIPIEAEDVGAAFDVAVGAVAEIADLASDANFIEALVVSAIQGGLDREGNQELFERTRKARYTRNLVNAPSVDFLLREVFGQTIQDLLTVGMSDPEMRRDLKRIVDAELGEMLIHLGNHSDIYVRTPITRRAVEIPVPAGALTVDLSPYRALLKIHGATVKGQDGVTPYTELVNCDPRYRFSAVDPVALAVDPGLADRVLVLDISYAPDVVLINDWVNGADNRLSMANVLVRHFVPVWLYGNIFVDGADGQIVEAGRLMDAYVNSVSGQDGIVVSKITEAIHAAGVRLVHQDFMIGAQVFLPDGSLIERESDTFLTVPARPEISFTARISRYINEGILLTALSQ